MSYDSIFRRCRFFAFGLLELVQKKDPNFLNHILKNKESSKSREDTFNVGICGRNSSEWVIADISCIFANTVSIPIHYGSEQDTFENILTISELHILVLTKEMYCKYESVLKNHHQIVLIFFDGIPKNADRDAYTFEQVERIGEEKMDQELFKKLIQVRNADDYMFVGFTSGSTGVPKGIPILDGRCKLIEL